MSDSLDIPRLAEGVSALVFDGETARPHRVILRLNLASLSQRVTIHICDAQDDTVLSSCGIQELKVVNPRSQASQEAKAEIWLELKNAQIQVKDFYNCRAIERWLRQFARRQAWQGHDNMFTIVACFVGMCVASLTVSTVANIATDSVVPMVSAQQWQQTSNRQDGLQKIETCDHDGITQTVNPILGALMPSTNVSVQMVRNAPGRDSIYVRPGGTIVLNARALRDLEDGGAATAGLALALSNAERKRQETRIINAQLQLKAAQFSQLKLVTSVDTLILTQIAVSQRQRQQQLSIDRATIDRLEVAGFSADNLTRYLSALAQSSDPLVSQRILPFFLNDSTDPATRRASVGTLLGTATFVPQSANAGLSDQDLDLLVQVCG